MKKRLLTIFPVIILFLMLMFIQISCKKESTTQNNATSNCIGPQPKFQFKANGIQYVCDALFDQRIGWYGDWIRSDGRRQIIGSEVPSVSGELSGGKSFMNGNNYIRVSINLPLPNNVPTLTPVNVQNGWVDCTMPGFTGYLGKGNYTINFTRVSNDGYADGTFSGVIWQTSAPTQTVSITEGSFSNIPFENL